ncbi:MAG: sigma-70 family RNA polymerase sigma factor [Planctomycetota bacterium]
MPPHRPTQEDLLIERSLAGDPAALQGLLVRNLPTLETYIRLRSPDLVGPRESVTDLAQSTCREILENLDRFQHGGEGHFRAWLYETADRKLKNRRRHNHAQRRDVKRVRPMDSAHDAARHLAGFRGVHTPSAHAEAREELDELVDCLDEIGEEPRRLILLARIAKIPHRVIAERQKMSEATVRQALHRALAALAERIASRRRPEPPS